MTVMDIHELRDINRPDPIPENGVIGSNYRLGVDQ